MICSIFKNLISFLVFLTLPILVCKAQTHLVRGTIYNVITSQPIGDIPLEIKELNSQKLIVKINNQSNGKFEFEISDTIPNIDFVFSTQFNVVEIKKISQDQIDIYLYDNNVIELSLEELLKIKISTAGKQAQNISEIPASVFVIYKEDIEKMGYLYLKDIIANIPGYYKLSNLGIDAFGVRGFAKDKGLNFLVLLNGINISDDQTLGYYDIPVDAIDKIEIIRGPMSVIYGDNSFFGVINIFTNNNNNNYLANKAQIMKGTNSFTSEFLNFSNKIDEFQYTFNVSNQESNGSNFDLTKMMKDPSRLNESFFGGQNNNGLGVPENARTTKDKLSWNQKFFNVNIKDKNFYANLLYIESMRELYYYYPSLVDGSNVSIIKSSIAFGYKYDLSTNFTFDSKIVYDRQNRKNIYDLISPKFGGMESYYTSKLNVLSDAIWKIDNQLNISMGLEYQSFIQNLNEGDVPQGGAPNYRFDNIQPNDESKRISAYTQIHYHFLDNFICVAGVRMEREFSYGLKYNKDLGLEKDSIYYGNYSDDHLHFFPRLALIYNLNNNNVLKLLIGRAGKHPSPEVIGDDFLDQIDGFKNLNFSKTEFITTYELNYSGKIYDNVYMNISAFRNELDNLLIEKSFINDESIVRVLWTNRGKMETLGFEGTISSQIFENTRIEVSSVFQKTNDLELNTDASYSPHLLSYIKLYQSIYNGLSFSLRANFIDKMKAHFNTAYKLDSNGLQTNQYIGRTSDEVDANFTFDVNLRYEFPIQNKILFAYLNIQNLLNQEVFFPTFSINNDWADKGTLGNQRLVNLSFGLKF